MTEEVAILLAEGIKGKSRLVLFDSQIVHRLVGTECGIGASKKMKVKLDPFDPLALTLTGTIGKVVTDLAALIKLLWALLAALPSHAH